MNHLSARHESCPVYHRRLNDAPSSIKAVLFDLDDTLTDHKHSSRSGLEALARMDPCFARVDIEQLERDNLAFLNEVHEGILAGHLSVDDARREKDRRLLERVGKMISEDALDEVRAVYSDAYHQAFRTVPGAVELLRVLRSRAIRIGVVTNNLVSRQLKKIRRGGLDTLIDVMVVSEEVGVGKPDPAIFEIALRRLGTRAETTVMVGDSWQNDILGACGAGIRAIWLNRYGFACPEPARVKEITKLQPVDEVVRLILAGG